MASKLYVLEGQERGRSFDIEHSKIYTVGRSPDNDMQIGDSNISRYHLKIQKKEGKYFITDLKSKNGTFIGGKDIDPGIEVEVDEGVPIVIGMTILGLGEVCVTLLKPFLDSTGICDESYENGDVPKPPRVMAFKKNLEFIYSVHNSLMESRDINEISEVMFDCIFSLLKRIDRCVIILTDETGEISGIRYRSKKPVDDPKTAYNQPLVERALMLNKAVMVSDSYDVVDEDDLVTESLRLMKIKSAMCVPMCSCIQTRGVIYVDSLERPYGFRRGDLALLKDVSSRAALAMDNIELSESMRFNNN